jgi:hemolysin activation/secretion protein
MLRLSLLTAALLGAAGAVHAQQSLPNAGSLVQQIPPVIRPETRSGIDLVIPQQVREPVVEGARVHVTEIRVSGATLFPAEDLATLTGVAPGSDLTLSELRNAAAEIRLLQSQGLLPCPGLSAATGDQRRRGDHRRRRRSVRRDRGS